MDKVQPQNRTKNFALRVFKMVTVHPHLNLPHQGGGIQGDNEYSPPLVGGVRGGGELLLKMVEKLPKSKGVEVIIYQLLENLRNNLVF